MKLPNLHLARVDREKLMDYLLSPDHAVGGDKAVFFARFGFSLERWRGLADALIAHAQDHEVVTARHTEFGSRYTGEGWIRSPDGRNPRVRAVSYLDRGSASPRLITAYPLREKRT